MIPALLLTAFAPAAQDVFMAPAGEAVAKVVPGGVTVLPNGRLLTPQGSRMWTNDDLWKVVLSPDRKTIVAFDDRALNIFTGETNRPAKTVPMKAISPCGAFSPDGKLFLAGGGDSGTVFLLETQNWTEVGKFELNSDGVADAYPNDIAFLPNGKSAIVLDVATQKIVTLDIASMKVASRVNAGRQPYALALSADGKQLFVANIGIFNYSVIPPARNKQSTPGLKKPPFGFPSKEAEVGVEAEDRFVPGLGDARSPDGHSVFKYVLGGEKPKFVAGVKTGILIHAPADGGKAVGGSSPNALLLEGNRLWVSNANNDTVQAFDLNLKPLTSVKLVPQPKLKMVRGVIPSAMTLSRDKGTLYVAASGLNAVAGIDLKTLQVKGYFPTGWFPTSLQTGADGKLFVGTQKGLGRGPRGPERPKTDERIGLSEMPGMVHATFAPASPDKWLAATQTVLKNNGLLPTKQVVNFPPQIKHVVFITKENHTFDGIFGALGRGRGEPDYAEYGQKGWIREKGKEERVPIMPNHIKLANEFGISDNFYMEPQASGDGHRWLVGVYPSLWTTRVFYAGWRFKPTDNAKGRLASMGSDGSQVPEDYLENGSIWEHLHRNGINFRNYGEGYELPGSLELPPNSRTGTNYLVNHPMPKVLYDNTDFNFPAYNNNIPDIARADWFKEDIQKMFRSKGKPLPRFLNIAICNDHGASPNASRGFPYTASYMADNDLALGRIVEYLSRTPEWKNMAIFVTQDDSGGDNDHIDRHRSFVLAISPYAKRGYVSTRHTSIMSIIRSIYGIFGLGPNNMFDAVATPLDDMFTSKPDFTPYTHLPSDLRVFDPAKTFDPSDPDFKKRRGERPEVPMDDPKFVDSLRKQPIKPGKS